MTDVSLAPLVEILTPYAVQLSAVLIAGAATWAAARYHQVTGVDIKKGALDSLVQAANAEAGAAIAAASNNLAHTSIEVGNPIVADAASRIISAMPKVLDAAGVTPYAVATMVQGAIGDRQNAQPPAPLTVK